VTAGGGDPALTWLAVIDMQNIFGDRDSDWATPKFPQIVEPVAQLVRAYAPNAVFTRFVTPARPAGAWIPYYADWPKALVPPEDRAWDIVPELASAQAGTAGADGRGGTVVATTFSKWEGRLAELVSPGGTLVLCGVSTDCCVIATALQAADAGIHVKVVPEACAGVDDASHAAALHVMGLFAPLVEVVPLADALAAAPAR
jgi:nicotinamidase-related amidase